MCYVAAWGGNCPPCPPATDHTLYMYIDAPYMHCTCTVCVHEHVQCTCAHHMTCKAKYMYINQWFSVCGSTGVVSGGMCVGLYWYVLSCQLTVAACDYAACVYTFPTRHETTGMWFSPGEAAAILHESVCVWMMCMYMYGYVSE